jgi:hypothetical protein
MLKAVKLKPLHGWRAFVGEVGIIVLGVLIALAAQQVAENAQSRHLASLAESDIKAELAYDSAFAAERVAIGDCVRASITDLHQRLLADGDAWPGLEGKAVAGAAKAPLTGSLFAFQPPFGAPHRLWPTSAWATATSSGALNDVSRDRFVKFAALYAMVNWLGRLQDHEIDDYSRLMPFNTPQRLDPPSRLQLLQALGAADADNADAERLAVVFVRAARVNGIPPDKGWLERVVSGEARFRGRCVKQGPALDSAIAREFAGGGGLRL